MVPAWDDVSAERPHRDVLLPPPCSLLLCLLLPALPVVAWWRGGSRITHISAARISLASTTQAAPRASTRTHHRVQPHISSGPPWSPPPADPQAASSRVQQPEAAAIWRVSTAYREWCLHGMTCLRAPAPWSRRMRRTQAICRFRRRRAIAVASGSGWLPRTTRLHCHCTPAHLWHRYFASRHFASHRSPLRILGIPSSRSASSRSASSSSSHRFTCTCCCMLLPHAPVHVVSGCCALHDPPTATLASAAALSPAPPDPPTPPPLQLHSLSPAPS